MAKPAIRAIERYLTRLACPPDPLDVLRPPASDLKLCIVIPAMAELETLPTVLDSLISHAKRLQEAEVLVVVNAPENASPEILQNNLETLALLKRYENSPLTVHTIDRTSPGRAFSPDKSGVGHARRAGMDIALRRLNAVGNALRTKSKKFDNGGIIACLDGDSPVAPGYIDHLLDAFGDKKHLAGLCRYRHPLPEDPDHAFAMVTYELWLRYGELCLRHARSPYAFQTVGSCTVITALGYAMADGMSRKQAGEDFYMLEKLIKVGGPDSIARLDHILVQPAARFSKRVPFGTGVAVSELADHGEIGDVARRRYQFMTPVSAYTALGAFFAALPRAHINPDALERNIAPTVFAFLDTINGRTVIEKLRKNHATTDQFIRAFHTWFDALRTKQYGHFAKEYLGEQWIFDAFTELLGPANTADLPKITPESAPLAHQILWLERIRSLS